MIQLNDEEFEESIITKVRDVGDGWSIDRADGWTFFVPSTSPVKPKDGMTARFYGKGAGFSVRGLFLDGHKIYYRTETEDKEKQEIDLYGSNATDWLKRWDENESVWSIEMGGIGPSYEQCIQIAAAEILRHLLDKKYNLKTWGDLAVFKEDQKKIETAAFANTRISLLGLSGAQFVAAMQLAHQFYSRGPRAIMKDDGLKSRRIQVQRFFPGGI